MKEEAGRRPRLWKPEHPKKMRVQKSAEHLQSNFQQSKGSDNLSWDQARHARRDACLRGNSVVTARRAEESRPGNFRPGNPEALE